MLSEKEAIWAMMQSEFDEWQNNIHTEGYRSSKEKGVQYIPRTREQLFARWLSTDEGRKLYSEYESASDITPGPIAKVEEEPKTLKDFGWIRLEKIAEKYQEDHPDLTLEAAHLACSRENPEYQEIYGAVHDSYPLDTIDFSERISKSKADAIDLFKTKIIVASRRAGI